MNKVIFLDRDGTIIRDSGYVYKKEELVFLKNSIEGLKYLSELGFLLIIVTNQSGIGRCKYTVNEYNEFANYMNKKLNEKKVFITDTYFCPHVDEDNCECRKPKIAMFKDAIKKYNIDLNKSYAIGDNHRDLAICKHTKVRGILIGKTGKNYYSANDLLEAAYLIEQISVLNSK